VSHKGIRLLIENTAKSLGDDIQFTYGRDSDFNVMRDKRYPFIQLDLLNNTAGYTVDGVFNYNRIWNITMLFHELDKESSDQSQYQLILDDMDVLSEAFIHQLNNFTQQSDDIVLSAINKQPFIKTTADVLTGWLLTFTIQTPDDWDYCKDRDC
jgi:hypothetical protein